MTRTLPEIQQQIAKLKLEQQNFPALPNLAHIEAQITFHGARAIVGEDAPRHKAELEAAMIAKEQARPLIDRNDEINRELARLRTELAIAEAEQARLQHEQKQRAKQELVQEYRHAALAMIRAARKCMNANVDIGSFSVGFLETDPNGPFKLSDEMKMGLLRFEVAEREAA